MQEKEIIEKLQTANSDLLNLYYQTNNPNIRKEILGIILNINQRLDKISKVNEDELLDPISLRNKLQQRAEYLKKSLRLYDGGLIDGTFMPEIGSYGDIELVDYTPVITAYKEELEEVNARILKINQELGETEIKR